jgi:hypothetical protein
LLNSSKKVAAGCLIFGCFRWFRFRGNTVAKTQGE